MSLCTNSVMSFGKSNLRTATINLSASNQDTQQKAYVIYPYWWKYTHTINATTAAAEILAIIQIILNFLPSIRSNKYVTNQEAHHINKNITSFGSFWSMLAFVLYKLWLRRYSDFFIFITISKSCKVCSCPINSVLKELTPLYIKWYSYWCCVLLYFHFLSAEVSSR